MSRIMTMKERAAALMADPLVSITMVADEWGCSPNFVRKLIKAEKLAAVRLSPRCYRIRRSELVRYMASQQPGAAA